ncbi:MAG: DUF72 domain-containing protein [Polyangiaceae bacterium]
MRVHVGTSGWQYASWKRTFYPPRLPQRSWLSYYATRFAIVEVNNSFYRLPDEATFARWRDATPPGFVFAVKANRVITHLQRMRGAELAVERFWSRAQHLGGKLGPVLFQFPPSLRADVPRLAEFLETLPFGMRSAFEFRDRSWLRDDVIELLDRAGAAWVLADRGGVKIPTIVTGGFAYVRFHHGLLDRPGYERDVLRRWAKRIASLRVQEAFAFFNNDQEVAAPGDAATLVTLLRDQGCDVTAPPPHAWPEGPEQLHLPHFQ